MATDNPISQEFTTISITTTDGDTITTGNFFCLIKNLDTTNSVNISDVAAPGNGAPSAGARTTLNKAPAGGAIESKLLRPKTKYFVTANTNTCLVAVEQIYAPTPRPI